MQFGNYQVLGEISRGSMGVIYKAHDRALDRTVAIKVMSTGGGEFAHEDQARFRREALAMARIRHPNVVAIHGAGMANGAPYIVLDFIEGESLADRLRRGPLKPRHAAKLGRDLAGALEAAHAEGVLHRDLKPANVLIDRKGKVLLTDFGLAKNMFNGDPLTLSEMVLGTPAYMSPEQAMGAVDRVGPRSDVYGLGAIVYALLTGRPPIKGKAVTEVLERVIDEPPPPPTSLQEGIDPELERVILRSLAKEPEDRYETPGQLKDALHSYLSPPSRTGPSSGSLLGASVLGSVLGFALGVGTTLAFWTDRSARPAEPAQVANDAPQEPTNDPDDATVVVKPVDESPTAQADDDPPTEIAKEPDPAPPTVDDDPAPDGPAPQEPGLRDVGFLQFQTALAEIPLPFTSGLMLSNTGMRMAVGQREYDVLLATLALPDDVQARAVLKQIAAQKHPYVKHFLLHGYARLGDVFACAEILDGMSQRERALLPFTEEGALARVLLATRSEGLSERYFAVQGGVWEQQGGRIRAGGKPMGSHDISTLVERNSQRPTGQFRLATRLGLEHMKLFDAAGVVLGGETATTYWVVYLKRINRGELELRVGQVVDGQPTEMRNLGTLPFETQAALQVNVTASTLKVEVGRASFTHELKEPVAQGYRGLFRKGSSVVTFSRLSYEPR